MRENQGCRPRGRTRCNIFGEARDTSWRHGTMRSMHKEQRICCCFFHYQYASTSDFTCSPVIPNPTTLVHAYNRSSTRVFFPWFICISNNKLAIIIISWRELFDFLRRDDDYESRREKMIAYVYVSPHHYPESLQLAGSALEAHFSLIFFFLGNGIS